MISNKHVHIKRIKEVAVRLDYLLKDVVFVGGSVVALYSDDPAADEVRPTEDVDIVVGIFTTHGFYDFESAIRKQGFLNDIYSGVICRYKVNDIIVDVMPVEEMALGFTNKWYKDGVEQSFLYPIDSDISIRLMPYHYFIASKIEAHYSRGKSDLRTSKDFEDIVYSFDSRLDPLADLLKAEGEVKEFLKEQIGGFLNDTNIDEGITGHLDRSTSSFRLRRIKDIWTSFLMS
jgi:hypothetical protein